MHNRPFPVYFHENMLMVDIAPSLPEGRSKIKTEMTTFCPKNKGGQENPEQQDVYQSVLFLRVEIATNIEIGILFFRVCCERVYVCVVMRPICMCKWSFARELFLNTNLRVYVFAPLQRKGLNSKDKRGRNPKNNVVLQ